MINFLSFLNKIIVLLHIWSQLSETSRCIRGLIFFMIVNELLLLKTNFIAYKTNELDLVLYILDFASLTVIAKRNGNLIQ